MKREDFTKIIKCRSYWKIDRRRGDYKLPGGCHLSVYVENLIVQQMELDKLGIAKDGNLYFNNDGLIMKPFGVNEKTNDFEQTERIEELLTEMIEGRR